MEQMENDDFDSFFLYIKQSLEGKQRRAIEDVTEWDFNLGFRIKIPSEFAAGDKETAGGIFWSEKRPPILLLTPERKAGITFRRLDGKFEEKHSWIEFVRQTIRRVDERTVFYDSGETGVDKTIQWLEYKSFAADERIYNLTFMFEADGQRILGNFYCVFEDYERWKPVAFRMFETIKQEVKGEKKDEGV